MLLQTDGSRHDWLEGRGPVMTLVAASTTRPRPSPAASFRAPRTLPGYFEMLRQTVRRHGLPLALYSDLLGDLHQGPRPAADARRAAHRAAPPDPGRPGARRARRSAGSAPAARRRRAGSSACGGPSRTGSCPSCGGPGRRTLEDANALLAWYLPGHNRRFAVEPADPGCASRSDDAEPAAGLGRLPGAPHHERIRDHHAPAVSHPRRPPACPPIRRSSRWSPPAVAARPRPRRRRRHP